MRFNQVDPKREMAAYDKLPAELRRALATSDDQYSAAQMFFALRKGHTCRELITMIHEEDAATRRHVERMRSLA